MTLHERVGTAKSSIISTLKNTVWPRKSRETSKELLRIIENAQSLQKIPNNENQIPAESREAIENLINFMEDAGTRLLTASNKYGANKRGLVDKIKSPFPCLRGAGCTEVLQVCRNEVRNALAPLPENWDNEVDKKPSGKNPASGDQSSNTQGNLTPTVNRAEGNTNPAPKSTPTQSSSAPDGQNPTASRRREWLGLVRKTLSGVEAVSGTIPVVGSYVGAAAKVGAALVEMVQIMESNDEVSEELVSRTSRLSDLLKHFEHKQGIESRQGEVTTYVSEVQGELKKVQDEVEKLKSSGIFKKVFSSGDNAEALKGYQETLLIGLNTTDLVAELYNAEAQKEKRRLLDRLGDAYYGARGEAIDDVLCLAGTRVQILERIDTWMRDTATSERVFWIRGMAGRGKSTIASTVAYRWRYRAACAIFHFRRGQNALDNRLILSLARQLGSNGVVSGVKESILQSIGENEDIAQDRLQEQFEALIVGSLKRIQNTSIPILLVVDALDECGATSYATKFLQLIGQNPSSLPTNVKFLITSRPEVLGPKQWPTVDLDLAAGVDDDVAQFLQQGFSKIDRMEYDLEDCWPPREDIQTLVRMSQGLFQWAHTALEYIKEGSPVHRLQEILTSPSIWDGLDELYLQILSKAFKNVKSDTQKKELVLRTLSTLVAGPYPISLETFAFLYADHPAFHENTQERIVLFLRLEVLKDLRSIIYVPNSPKGPIRLVHTSVRDLLVNTERCDKSYAVDIASSHFHLARECFRFMIRDLGTNMCKLSDLSKANSELDVQDLVRNTLPEGLQYCCRSWTTHLTEGVPIIDSDAGAPGVVPSDLKQFSEEKLLGWLEVMSLTGDIQNAIKMARQVYQWLKERDSSSTLTVLWDDVGRFTTAFHEPITFGALHIYSSALPWCPVKTELWNVYQKHAMVRWNNKLRDLHWSPTLWSRSTGQCVDAVAFSPDGKTVASGCFSFHTSTSVIVLWDAATGTPIGEPLEGHTGPITSVAFSPDGQTLASGSYDGTVRLWNVLTEAKIEEPLVGHGSGVTAVVFSPDGNTLASGTEDKTIWLWDFKTRAPIGTPLAGHTAEIRAVTFSKDGSILASGSDDVEIRLWDVKTRTQVGAPLKGHTDSVQTVAFSCIGKTLASGSKDKTIILWDITTGRRIGKPLLGHDDVVTTVAFSPDGKTLASGSGDETIRLWDVGTTAPIGEPMADHDDGINSIAYSPDGKTLVSISRDDSIRMWDVGGGTRITKPLTGHEGSVTTIVFSLDGKVLASGSEDETIRLWDIATGTPLRKPLKSHDHFIKSVALSPNGMILASGSADSTVRLWDFSTGALIGEPLSGHEFSVNTVAFSLDSKILASGSDDGTVRLWDVVAGAPIGEPLTGHEGPVMTIAFSPDGKFLVSGSDDETIWSWDVAKRAPTKKPLVGHDSSVNAVAFSPNGKTLASGLEDGKVLLWDVKKRVLVGEALEGHTDTVNAVVFSPDGNTLASGSDDGTICLWDVKVRMPIGEPLAGHESSVTTVAFSPDGKTLASGSTDESIWFWDIKTRSPIGEPFMKHDNSITGIAFSPDGLTFASGSGGLAVWLWDINTGAPLGKLLSDGADGLINALAFSPDGGKIASGSLNGAIQLWDVATRTQIGEPIEGHDASVTALAFSPDGKTLASGSDDKTTMLWDVTTGRERGGPLGGHDYKITTVAFSLDSRIVVSGSLDGMIRLWDPDTGNAIGEPLPNSDDTLVSVTILADGKVAIRYGNGTVVLRSSLEGRPSDVALTASHLKSFLSGIEGNG